MVKRSWLLGISVGLVVAALADQVTKWWFLNHQNSSYVLVSGALSLDFTRNYGLAFGLTGNRWVIVGISLLLLVFLVWFAVAEWKNKHQLASVAALLMALGAVSNVLDRIRFGYVVDWINVQYWSVFNLADVWITVAALLIVYQYWRHDYGKKAKSTQASPS